jgi:hypothetical protein
MLCVRRHAFQALRFRLLTLFLASMVVLSPSRVAVAQQQSKIIDVSPPAPTPLSGAPNTDPIQSFDLVTNGLVFNDKADGTITDYFRCSSACPKAGGKVLLRVTPEQSSALVDWVSTWRAGPGFFVARITNVDPRNVDYPDLHIGKDESVYEWVGQLVDKNVVRSAAFYKITSGSVSGPYEPIDYFNHCNDPDTTRKAKVMQKKTHKPGTECDPFFSNGGGTGVRFPLDGLWTSCSAGCCEIKQTRHNIFSLGRKTRPRKSTGPAAVRR